MKIGIIGGGSIGLLFSYYLSEFQPVCIYVRTKEQMEILKSEGLFLKQNDHLYQKFIDVKLYSEWRGLEDVTIIAVKQYQLPNLIELLYAYSRSDHSLLFLQNGMGHIKWLDKFQGEVLVGTVEHGAMRTKANCVNHTGLGLTKIASYHKSQSALLFSMKSIDDGRFPFIIEENYENMLLKKLVVNAVINPLTAILGVKNGELLRNGNFFQIAKLIFREIEQSLNLQDGSEYFENVMTVCEKTAHNQSSMLRDLEENRPTEVDAILGYILEKAVERKINTPVIESFYQAVKGKECRTEG